MKLSTCLIGVIFIAGLSACGSAPTSGPAVTATSMTTDIDGDGIPGNNDRCEDTPTNVRVDARGCALDSDNDGIADYADRCANTPSAVTVDEWGCPPTKR